MKIIIKDENSNEEILFDNSYYLTIFTAFTIIGMFFGLWALGIYGIPLLFLFMFLFNWDWNERIIFDKGMKSIIMEERKVIGREFKWKVTNKIKFSDIKGIYVIEDEHEHCYDTGEVYRDYNIELIIDEESTTKLPSFRFSAIISSSGSDEESTIKLPSKKDSKRAKEFAIRLCKSTGINGYYIDEKKNSTALFEA